MDFRLALSLELLEQCRQRSLTLGQLSAKADVPVSTLKNIINGQSRNPGILTLRALCGGLEISLADFIAELEETAKEPERDS